MAAFLCILYNNCDDFIELENYTNLDVLLISSMSLLAGEKNKTLDFLQL